LKDGVVFHNSGARVAVCCSRISKLCELKGKAYGS
jgi:hypothetical protein